MLVDRETQARIGRTSKIRQAITAAADGQDVSGYSYGVLDRALAVAAVRSMEDEPWMAAAVPALRAALADPEG